VRGAEIIFFFNSYLDVCTYHTSCTVYYPYQQTHNTHTHTHINNKLYNVSTPTCFNTSA